MLDDIAIEVARIEREAFRTVVERIRSRQLGEAFRDLPFDQPQLKEAA